MVDEMIKVKIYESQRFGFFYPSINHPILVNGKTSWGTFTGFYDDYCAEPRATLPLFRYFLHAVQKYKPEENEKEFWETIKNDEPTKKPAFIECPFCGGQNIEADRTTNGVKCSACNAWAPAEIWNNRV